MPQNHHGTTIEASHLRPRSSRGSKLDKRDNLIAHEGAAGDFTASSYQPLGVQQWSRHLLPGILKSLQASTRSCSGRYKVPHTPKPTLRRFYDPGMSADCESSQKVPRQWFAYGMLKRSYNEPGVFGGLQEFLAAPAAGKRRAIELVHSGLRSGRQKSHAEFGRFHRADELLLAEKGRAAGAFCGGDLVRHYGRVDKAEINAVGESHGASLFSIVKGWDCKVMEIDGDVPAIGGPRCCKELGIPDFHTEDRLAGCLAENNVWQSVSSPCEQRFGGHGCIVSS